MSKTQELQKRRQERARKRQLTIILGVVGVALALIGFSAYQNTRPVGDIVLIEKQSYPSPDGKALGAQGAPVLIQEFADFQCPFCGRYAREVEPQVIEVYLGTGRVRYEYHHYIVVDGNVGGSESRQAAQASECASEQGEFWNYHKLVFANQNGEGRGAFADRRLKAFAETLALDTPNFNACFDSGKYTQIILADDRLARSLGVQSTPTLFVNGTLIANPLDFDEIRRAVEAALAAN